MWKVLLLSCVALAAADVRRPPQITTNPKALLIFEQNSKNLPMDCVADGEPAVTYSWEKNGQDFSMNRETVLPSKANGSFTFTVVNTADAGYYQCFAKNLYGKAMSQISSLQRAVLGEFLTRTEPLKYEVNQGNKLMVPCNSPKSYPEPTYSWAIADNMEDKNPAEITQSKRIMLDLNGDLHFANVEPNDYQGGRIYLCRAYNPNLRTLRAGSESQIIVNTGTPSSSRPMLEFNPSQSEVVLAGRTMTFQCIFSGFPTPNVKFSRVGGAMPFERYKSLRHGTVMQITNVTEADEGQYKCTGSNSDINGENSFEFSVYVEVIPVFETTDNRPYSVNKTEGESVSFACNPKAEPEASIQWFKNGDPIDSDSPGPRMSITENNRKLTIMDLCKTCSNGQTDLQVIQCNASNVHGYAFAEGYVNVLEKEMLNSPTQPYIIAIILVISVLAISIVVALLIIALRQKQGQHEPSNNEHPANPPLKGSPVNQDANYEYIDTSEMSNLHQNRGGEENENTTYEGIGPSNPEEENTYTILNAST